MYEHLKINWDKLPEADRDLILMVAKKYDALADGHIGLRDEFDRLAGKTPEEKNQSNTVMTWLRQVPARIHGRRFDLTLFAVQGFALVGILRWLGVTPAQFSRGAELILKIRRLYT